MTSDAFMPSGSVDTTVAPASPRAMPTAISLSASGGQPAIDGPHPPSPMTSPSSREKQFPTKPVEGDRSQTQLPHGVHGAKHPQTSGFPIPHMPLGSPSQGPQFAANLFAIGLGPAAANGPAGHGQSSFGSGPASWPGSSSASNPQSFLGLDPNPAVWNHLLASFPSGYPTGAASSHASIHSGFGTGPVSPPASVGVVSRSPYTSPQPGPDSSSGFPFPTGASPPPPVPPPGVGPSDAFPGAWAPTSPTSRVLSPPHFGLDAVSMQALPRSLSADASAPQHALFEAVHLLRQQLSFLVQAWMSDRERLERFEPGRQQTEGEIQQLRTAMNVAREQWTSERSAMEHQVEALKAQIHQLQEENAAFKAAQASTGNSVLSPTSLENGGLRAPAGSSVSSGTSGPAAAVLSPNPSQQSSNSKTDVFSLPPGLDGASRRPHFARSASSRTSPTGAPKQAQPASMDPRTQPQDSVPNDFLAPLPKDETLPAPIIDVQEIDPKLEGIPIKANAVQRSTFVLASSQGASARKNAPGLVAGRRRDSPARRWSPHNLSVDRGRPSRGIRASSRDQTIQVLAAEESRRLTMHAGHTPNHSFSLIPTMTATGGDSTGCHSQRETPSARTQSISIEHDEIPVAGDDPDNGEQGQDGDADAGLHSHSPDVGDEDLKGHLEALDDVPLKGPLMIKNIPAQDDLFFAKLDQKLESISRGQNALPSVLQAALEEEAGQATAGPSCVPEPRQQPVAGDASHDSRSGTEDEEGDGGKHVEPEVPLRFKSTSNFGAPFGSA